MVKREAGNAQVATGSRWRGFFVGAWMNRKYTRSASSVLLGLGVGAALLLPFFVPYSGRLGSSTVTGLIVWGVVSTLMFPAVRECYFRLARPVHEGLGGFVFFGPLVVVALVVKVLILVFLWSVSIPVGFLAVTYLGITEIAGQGWRTT